MNEVVAETQRKRRRHLASRKLGSVELYWTLCIHPPKARRPRKPSDHEEMSGRLLRRLQEALISLEQNFSELAEITRLDFHGVARLYGHIANLDPAVSPQRLRSRDRVDRQLARVAVEWKREGLQIGRQHVRLFSLMQRPGSTPANSYGDLLKLHADFVLVFEIQRRSAVETRKCVSGHQTFKDLFRHSFLSVLAHAKSGREIAKSANTVAADKGVDDLGSVIDDIENRGLNYCEASLIGLLHSTSKAELEEQMAQVYRLFSQSDSACWRKVWAHWQRTVRCFPLPRLAQNRQRAPLVDAGRSHRESVFDLRPMPR